MFDPLDLSTQKALFELRDIRSKGKPIVLWIGAGASRWAGYPTWEELGEKLHSQFIKFEANYDVKAGTAILQAGALPSFFSFCKKANPHRYFNELSSALSNHKQTPVYSRFIALLANISPLILTTNIDESLEKNIPILLRYQNSDIQFAEAAISAGTPFICKLHGTSSAIASTVWSDEDYRSLVENKQFTASLARIMSSSTIVFLGYGLRDEYVLNLLAVNDSLSNLLGDGPHFVISSSDKKAEMAASIRTIKYLTDNQSDHRGALSILDLLQPSIKEAHAKAHDHIEERFSAVYLPDYLISGTWHTSQTITFTKESDGKSAKAIIGNGFVKEELPDRFRSALHDLLVGLISFDKIYVPIASLGKLHTDIGQTLFQELIDSDALRLIWITGELSLHFPEVDSVSGGGITSLTLMDQDNPHQTIRFSEALFRQILPVTNTEEHRADLVSRIEKITVRFDKEKLDKVPYLTESALISPTLRSSLGIGDGILTKNLPQWFAFPVLRVANVVRDAEICRLLGICSAKMPFASDGLANATYGLLGTKLKADDIASYVIAGKTNIDLGSFAAKNADILNKILKFRESETGMRFRREIFNQLQTNEGAEFIASINSALKGMIPLDILGDARDAFTKLQILDGATAIWTEGTNLSDPFSSWKKQSKKILEEICKTRKITAYDLCPCGSGDKLRFCCGKLLH